MVHKENFSNTPLLCNGLSLEIELRFLHITHWKLSLIVVCLLYLRLKRWCGQAKGIFGHFFIMWWCELAWTSLLCFFLLFHFEEVRKLPILLLSGGKILFIFFPPGGRLPFFFFLNKQRQTLIISEMKQSKHSFSFPLWSHCVWFIPWRFWPWSLTSETT